MVEKMREAIDNLRPMIQRDGGDVEFVNFDEDEGIVYVQMLGACRGCPSSYITLKSGIEYALQLEYPGIVKGVEQLYID